MSTHIYIHSLHIFVYAHVFAHIQIHYFQAGILLTLAVALKGGYSHVHTVTQYAH